MDIIGTIKMYIYHHVLGGRKLVEAAVIRSKKKETLISLDLLKRWDLVHESFPYQTISDYIYSNKDNKRSKAYSAVYNFHSQQFKKAQPSKNPPKNATVYGTPS